MLDDARLQLFGGGDTGVVGRQHLELREGPVGPGSRLGRAAFEVSCRQFTSKAERVRVGWLTEHGGDGERLGRDPVMLGLRGGQLVHGSLVVRESLGEEALPGVRTFPETVGEDRYTLQARAMHAIALDEPCSRGIV